MFHHPGRNILTVVHGDDYASTVDEEHLEWLKAELERKFEIKTTMIGLGVTDASEGKILNRSIRVTKDGWEIEADPRHAELLIEQHGLEGANPRKITAPPRHLFWTI